MTVSNKKNAKIKKSPEALSLQLFAAFYPGFYLLELTLKNRLFDIINNKLGADWFSRRLETPDSNDTLFQQEKELILKRKAKKFTLTDKGLLVESGLGFWVEFFNRPMYKETKGIPIGIFENLPKAIKRKDIYQKLERIKEVRNQLYHSRIAPFSTTSDLAKLEKLTDVAEDMSEILEWLGNIPADLTGIKRVKAKAVIIKEYLAI